jgi:hypothetical protein
MLTVVALKCFGLTTMSNVGLRSKRALQLHPAGTVLDGHFQGLGRTRNVSRLEADLGTDAGWRGRRGCRRCAVRLGHASLSLCSCSDIGLPVSVHGRNI